MAAALQRRTFPADCITLRAFKWNGGTCSKAFKRNTPVGRDVPGRSVTLAPAPRPELHPLNSSPGQSQHHFPSSFTPLAQPRALLLRNLVPVLAHTVSMCAMFSRAFVSEAMFKGDAVRSVSTRNQGKVSSRGAFRRQAFEWHWERGQDLLGQMLLARLSLAPEQRNNAASLGRLAASPGLSLQTPPCSSSPGHPRCLPNYLP